MAKLTSLLLGASAALVLVACGRAQNSAANQPPPPPVDQAAEAAQAQLAKQSANERVVESFFRPGISMDERLALISPDYIQHDPALVRFAEVNQVQNGRDAFKLMLDALSRLHGGGSPFGPPPGAATHGPQPPQGNALFKVVADGDLVTVVHQHYAPDPQHQGMFYETYTVDTFRLQEGKIAEHWDDATLPTTGPMARLMRTPVSRMRFPKATQPIY